MESAMVSCADKIHNLMSTEYAYSVTDVSLFDKMQMSFLNQKLFYDKVFLVCEEKLGKDHVLVTSYRETLARVTTLFI